jgi:hypothetical protein
MGQTRVLSTNQAERLETLERGESQQQAKHREREKKKQRKYWMDPLFLFFPSLFFFPSLRRPYPDPDPQWMWDARRTRVQVPDLVKGLECRSTSTEHVGCDFFMASNWAGGLARFSLTGWDKMASGMGGQGGPCRVVPYRLLISKLSTYHRNNLQVLSPLFASLGLT